MNSVSVIEAAQAGDKASMEQLVQENTGLIWSVARRFFGRGVDPDDLFQLGCVGFLKAVEGFDTGFGTRFSTYAVPKISGEIRRFLRDDGTVKVSRTLKERAAAIHKMREFYLETMGTEPSVKELAEALELTPEEVATAAYATGTAESIQRTSGEEGFTLEDILTNGSPEDALVERLTLQQAISELPEREQQVLKLRYAHCLTQQRCAAVLGVSQVQISRIEKRAVEHLRSIFDSLPSDKSVVK